MAIEIYLAMSAAQFHWKPVPERAAWMACHFSPCTTGLSNLPGKLPEGSILILDDSVPIDGHDPRRILRQLETLEFGALLLDLQRPATEELRDLVQVLDRQLSRRVAVTEQYAAVTSGPVLLPPVPPYRRPEDHLNDWSGRELWLELAAEGARILLTRDGAKVQDWETEATGRHRHEGLCCSYDIRLSTGEALFFLRRDDQDLSAMLGRCEALGVTRAIGLWQELG